MSYDPVLAMADAYYDPISFRCPHCGDDMVEEQVGAVFNEEQLLFFCCEDCESEYLKGRA